MDIADFYHITLCTEIQCDCKQGFSLVVLQMTHETVNGSVSSAATWSAQKRPAGFPTPLSCDAVKKIRLVYSCPMNKNIVPLARLKQKSRGIA